MTDRSYVAVGQRARQYRPETGHTVQQVFLHPPERTCLPAGTLATVRAVGTVGRDNPGCHTVLVDPGVCGPPAFPVSLPHSGCGQVAGRGQKRYLSRLATFTRTDRSSDAALPEADALPLGDAFGGE